MAVESRLIVPFPIGAYSAFGMTGMSDGSGGSNRLPRTASPITSGSSKVKVEELVSGPHVKRNHRTVGFNSGCRKVGPGNLSGNTTLRRSFSGHYK